MDWRILHIKKVNKKAYKLADYFNKHFKISIITKKSLYKYLDSLNIENVTESRVLQANNFRVYPNFDLSQVSWMNPANLVVRSESAP